MKRTSALIMILVVGLFFMASSQPENGDVNCDGGINIMDVVHTINYLYKDGPQPCAFVGSGLSYKDYSGDPPIYYSPPDWITVDSISITVPDSGYICFRAWINVFCSDYNYIRCYLTSSSASSPTPNQYAEYNVEDYSDLNMEIYVKADSATTITRYIRINSDKDLTVRKWKLSAIYYPIKY